MNQVGHVPAEQVVLDELLVELRIVFEQGSNNTLQGRIEFNPRGVWRVFSGIAIRWIRRNFRRDVFVDTPHHAIRIRK
jgi:hypothetical protein